MPPPEPSLTDKRQANDDDEPAPQPQDAQAWPTPRRDTTFANSVARIESKPFHARRVSQKAGALKPTDEGPAIG